MWTYTIIFIFRTPRTLHFDNKQTNFVHILLNDEQKTQNLKFASVYTFRKSFNSHGKIIYTQQFCGNCQQPYYVIL